VLACFEHFTTTTAQARAYAIGYASGLLRYVTLAKLKLLLVSGGISMLHCVYKDCRSAIKKNFNPGNGILNLKPVLVSKPVNRISGFPSTSLISSAIGDRSV